MKKRLPLGEAVAALWAVTDEGRQTGPMQTQPKQLPIYWNEITKDPPYRFCVPPELWCDCHRQSIISDSMRGAPPLIRQGFALPPSPRGRHFIFPTFPPLPSLPGRCWHPPADRRRFRPVCQTRQGPGRFRCSSAPGYPRCPAGESHLWRADG